MKEKERLALISVEDLRPGIGSIAKNIQAVWADSIVVAMENQWHCSGTTMALDGYLQCRPMVSWEPVETKQGYEDIPKLHEYAACGVAILILHAAFGLVPKSMTCISDRTGVDFWMETNSQENNLDEFNFLANTCQALTRLEVKGRGRKSALRSALKQGIKQSLRSECYHFPVYIVACEFESPSVLIEYRDGNA